MSENIILSSRLLPKFSIRRVVITDTESKKEAKLICALLRPRELNYENWLGSSEFTPFIKFYFVASNRIIPSAQIASLSNTSQRIEFLVNLTPERHPIRRWEDVLGPQTQEQLDAGAINPLNLVGWQSRSLEEILQGQYFIRDPLTATQAIEPMHPDAMDDPEQYNSYFEINLGLVGEKVLTLAEKLDIMAFCQVDIEGLQQRFEIPEPGFLASLGGPLIIENCLVLDEENQYQTALKTRKLYYTEDGIIYQGPKHYHNAQNPGPNGYIGWMSGPPNGPMDERFRLSVREVPNNKVVYRSSTERALNFNGQALTNENSFSGFSLDSDMFSTSENGLLSFGDDVMQALESQVGHIVNLGPATSNNTVQQETERLSRSASLR